MNILQVIPTYYPAVRYGGPIRSVHGLARSLAMRGHKVHVYTTSVDGEGDSPVPIATPVNLDGVAVQYFAVRTPRRLFYSPDLHSALRRDIAKFDVVHTHSMYLHPSWAAARAAQRKRVPLFVSPRGMLVRELIRRKNRWVKQAWIGLIEQRTLRYASGLHVTTQREADDYAALRLPPLETYCIPNGVEFPAKPEPLPYELLAKLPERFALFLGRISWKKGLDRLLDAWRLVPSLPLLVFGNDEDGYRAHLEKMLVSFAVSNRVAFMGEISDRLKWSLYRKAQMLLLPSYSENFGNVIAEAMSAGCPVIVTPEVGLASMVRDFQCGIVVDGSAREIAAAVSQLDTNLTLATQLGSRGCAAARAHLSWSAVAEQMERAYESAMRAKLCGSRS